MTLVFFAMIWMHQPHPHGTAYVPMSGRTCEVLRRKYELLSHSVLVECMSWHDEWAENLRRTRRAKRAAP